MYRIKKNKKVFKRDLLSLNLFQFFFNKNLTKFFFYNNDLVFFFSFFKSIFLVKLVVGDVVLNSRFCGTHYMLIGTKRWYKLNWFGFTRTRFKLFQSDFFTFFDKNYFFSDYTNTPTIILKNIVFWKKKTSMFRKKNKIEYNFLKRLNYIRFNFNELYKDKSNVVKKKNLFLNLSSMLKSVDLKYRSNLIWYDNRKFFKDFFFLPKIRQFQITRFLSSLLKGSNKMFMRLLQNSITNMLIAAKFIFTKKESEFFVKNGLVYINGIKVNDLRGRIHAGDRFSLAVADVHYHFYKHNFHSKSKFFRGLSHRLWVLNRFKFNFYKQSTTQIPSYFKNVLFFYEDVPIYLEIDYTILTAIMIYEPEHFIHFNFFLKKTLNLFLLRQYNWNYLT